MGRYTEPNDAGGDADQYNDERETLPERDWDEVRKDDINITDRILLIKALAEKIQGGKP